MSNTITAEQFRKMPKAVGKGGRVIVSSNHLEKALKNADREPKIISQQIAGQKIRLNIKPMSVNRAYKGRQIHTEEYAAYKELVLAMMPAIEIPKPPYKVTFEFAFSNKAADVDGPVKVLQDTLQKAYNFNDKLIYELSVKKIIVPKGEEYFTFKIDHLKQ